MVSVITPCYNAERYISACIESVLAQTYNDWEMLIVDDCSEDRSAEIIREYCAKDCRIKYFKTEWPSGSPTLPRNMAIEFAKGEIVGFLDSDDIWLPEKLEEQLACMRDNNAVFVFSDYEKMTHDGVRAGRIVRSDSVVTLQNFKKGNPIGCLTAMIDISRTGKFRFSSMRHEDCIAWIGILQIHKVAYNTGTITAAYRESPNSVSSNKFKILSWQWKIYRLVMRFNILKSAYYYAHYAYRAYKKSKI